jgi:uncharacterized membrane protein YeaQ/YmgE (transglycosylase-associated protein family)
MLAVVVYKDPETIIGWIVLGLVAGWLAGKIMGEGGFGVIGDIIVGLLGALIGGFVVGFFWSGTTGIIGSLLISVIGACILVALIRAIAGNRVATRI